MAMGALRSPHWAPAASMKSARVATREVMSASSIDRSGKRWKNANRASNGMPPRTARIGDSWRQIGGKFHEFVLIATGAMQQHQRWLGWVGAWDEVVDVGHRGQCQP